MRNKEGSNIKNHIGATSNGMKVKGLFMSICVVMILEKLGMKEIKL